MGKFNLQDVQLLQLRTKGWRKDWMSFGFIFFFAHLLQDVSWKVDGANLLALSLVYQSPLPAIAAPLLPIHHDSRGTFKSVSIK